MAKTVVYTNTQLYSNEKTFDGNPIDPGKVKAPFPVDLYGLSSDAYISDNLKTWRFGEFRYKIGFMGINAACFDSYMHDFWKELNSDMEMRREGRCIIGENPDGTDRICPNSNRCKGCPNKGLYERHNRKRVDVLSLDFQYENEDFDIEDDRYPSVEQQVVDAMCPEPTYEKRLAQTLEHFEKKDPRQALIIKLKLEGKSIDEICDTIGLKSSRGREVINETTDAICDYLGQPHMKTKHRK